MSRKTRSIALGGLLALALAFRLALALGVPNNEPDDSRVYSLLARNLLTHGVYSAESSPPYLPTYVRVPGYPLFLAGVYAVAGHDNNTAARAVQALLETGTCWLVAALALSLLPASWPFRQRARVQVATLAIAAVCPFAAVYVTTILTEVWAIGLGVAVAVTVMRAIRRGEDVDGKARRSRGRVWWLMAGLAAGALTMIRPEGGLLAAGAGTVLLVQVFRQWRVGAVAPADAVKRLLGSGAALALGFILCVGPWVVRNAMVFRVFQPLAPTTLAMPDEFVSTGYTRWLRTWVAEPRYVGPFEFEEDRSRLQVDAMPPRAFDSPEERALVAALFAWHNDGEPGTPRDAGRSATEPVGMTPSLDARFEALARDRIRRHPLRFYALLPAERLFRLWFDTHSQYYPFAGDLFPVAELDPDRNQAFWLPVFVVLTALWSLFGLAGVRRLWREPGTGMGLFVLCVLIVPRLLYLGSLENPEPRYTVEVFPFLSALGGVAVGSVWSSLATREARRRPLP